MGVVGKCNPYILVDACVLLHICGCLRGTQKKVEKGLKQHRLWTACFSHCLNLAVVEKIRSEACSQYQADSVNCIEPAAFTGLRSQEWKFKSALFQVSLFSLRQKGCFLPQAIGSQTVS